MVFVILCSLYDSHFFFRKGDLENAVQHLELYVGVAEKMKLAKPLAMAYSAAGIMFNKLVSCIKYML